MSAEALKGSANRSSRRTVVSIAYSEPSQRGAPGAGRFGSSPTTPPAAARRPAT